MTQGLSAVAWPVHTDRLRLRPATPDDLEATWQIRRLPEVAEWLGHDFSDHDEYAERFLAPDRLATTLVVELDGRLIGDLMLHLEDPWAQSDVADQAKNVQAMLGWVLDRRTPGPGALLRRQRGVVATDGATGHAPRGVRRTRLAAPDARLAGRDDLRPARRRVAGCPALSALDSTPVALGRRCSAHVARSPARRRSTS